MSQHYHQVTKKSTKGIKKNLEAFNLTPKQVPIHGKHFDKAHLTLVWHILAVWHHLGRVFGAAQQSVVSLFFCCCSAVVLLLFCVSWLAAGTIWNHLEPSGTIWNHLEPSGTLVHTVDARRELSEPTKNATMSKQPSQAQWKVFGV